MDDRTKLLLDLQNYRMHNDADFRTLFSRSVVMLLLTDDECARMFDVSCPSVVRWRTGQTLPHETIRVETLKILAALLRKNPEVFQ
jgi:hypothetical protein